MTLGENIRRLRLGKGLSQEVLADHLGVSRQAVSKWEKDLSRPDTENLLSLAALLGVSADGLALLGQRETAPPQPDPAVSGKKSRAGKIVLVCVAVFLGLCLVLQLLLPWLFVVLQLQNTEQREVYEQVVPVEELPAQVMPGE